MYPDIVLTTHDQESLNSGRNKLDFVSESSYSCTTQRDALRILNRLWRNKQPNDVKGIEHVIARMSECKSKQSRSPSLSPKAIRKFSRKISSVLESHHDETTIFYAVIDEDVHLLEKLLANKNNAFDINTIKSPGISVFHQACAVGNLKIVELLIKNGADISLKTWTNLSPLKIAVLAGHYEVGQYLASLGANQDDVKNGFQKLV